jgi:hypothetical protein
MQPPVKLALTTSSAGMINGNPSLPRIIAANTRGYKANAAAYKKPAYTEPAHKLTRAKRGASSEVGCRL